MLDVIDTLRASLAPRYDVEREIGAGRAWPASFLAVEQHPHRRVAIKVLDPEVSTVFARAVIREVDLSSNLSIPTLCRSFRPAKRTGCFY